MTKLNPTGTVLIYSTYLGGGSSDGGSGIAVDAAGDAYVTGSTLGGFPTTVGAFQTTSTGGVDAFVTKLNSTGTGLLYSTYLGGSYVDFGGGIAVDAAGNAYVTGSTYSSDFPITIGAFQTTHFDHYENVFVTKLNPTGTGLLYSTYIGGSSSGDAGQSIAVDASGNAYITGYAVSTDFPTTIGAFQTSNAGGLDAFITQLNPTGTALLYSSFLGGNGQDISAGIAVDASGNVYIAGYTQSGNFPTTCGAFQMTTGGGIHDAFVAKIALAVPDNDANLSDLTLSTGTLTPAFSPCTTSYTASVLNATTSITVTPTVADSTATVTVNGLPVVSGNASAPINLSVGDNTITAVVTAQDGTTTKTYIVTVTRAAYSAQVQQPINADGSSVFNANRGVVPVKFTLTYNGVATCTLPPAAIAVTRTSGGTTGTIDEAVYVMAADNGSNFRIDGCQYAYNLSSSALGVGTYRVDIKINGQVVGSAVFQLN